MTTGDDHSTMRSVGIKQLKAREAKSGWSWSPPHLGLPTKTASELRDDLRRDR